MKTVLEIVELILSLLMGLVPYALVVYAIVRWRRKKARKKYQQEEAERQRRAEYVRSRRWEPVCTYLGGKFKEITMENHRAVYCYDYYSVGKFEENITDKDLAHREEILRFKGGDYLPMAAMLTDFLKGNFFRSAMMEWVICAIPASTREKHVQRYAKLLQEVADAAGIGNGLECIRIRYDRKNSREKKDENTVRNLEFDAERIRGKSVLLLDDITTRGTSFIQCAEKLYGCGAKFVCGFFMGKTVEL